MYRGLRSAASRRDSQHSYRQETSAKVEEDIEYYARKLELERKRLTNLNLAMKQLTSEVDDRKESIIKFHNSNDPIKNKLIYTRSLNAKKKTDTLHKKKDWIMGKVAELKAEIDQLRRDRASLLSNIYAAQQDIASIDDQVANQHTQMETKNKFAEQARMQLTTLQERFTKEQSSFHKKFKSLKQDYEWSVLNNLKENSHYHTNKQFDNFDTATLLKRQLQAIILNNKEKIKMIDSYQRNMRVLDEAFNTIKETSGLTNINEIEAIFVKSEEQNCALLTYLDMLNQEMDTLSDANDELERRCKQQEKENAERQAMLNSTPEEEKKKVLLEKIAKQKLILVSEVGDILTKISPKIIESACKLKNNWSQRQQVITRFNYERFLGDIDTCVNVLIKNKARQMNASLVEKALQIDSLPDSLPQMRVPDPQIDVPMENNSQLLYDYSKLQEVAKDQVKKLMEKKEAGQMRRRN